MTEREILDELLRSLHVLVQRDEEPGGYFWRGWVRSAFEHAEECRKAMWMAEDRHVDEVMARERP